MNPNPSLGLSPEQLLLMTQMLQASHGQQQQAFPTGNPGIPLQSSNPAAGMPGFHPGLMGLQMQQAMMQIQAHQQLHQLATAGLFQNAGTGPPLPFIPPSHIPGFPPGFPLQSIQPGASSSFTHRNDSAPTNIFSSADDDRLARTMHKGEGENLDEMLQALNGVNGHTTAQWVDRYVKNTKIIDQKIKRLETEASELKEPPMRPATAPSRPRQTSKHSPWQTHENAEQARPKYISPTTSKTQLSPHVPSLRSRQASGRFMSRSPTPPTTVVPSVRGNKYTDEDIRYLKKFLTHALKRDPRALEALKPVAIQLGERVPHHSADSWYRYMHRHNTAEEIKRRVFGEGDVSNGSESSNDDEEDEELQQEWEEPEPEEEEEEEEESEEDENEISLSSSESEGGLHIMDRRYIQKRGTGPAYPPSDRRALAKYIANITLAEWDNTPESWLDFQRKYNKHSVNAWRKWYMVKHTKKAVNRMARRFEIRNTKRQLEARRPIMVTRSPRRTAESFSRSPRAGPSVPEKRVRIMEDDEPYEYQLAKRTKPFPESPRDRTHRIKTPPRSPPITID